MRCCPRAMASIVAVDGVDLVVARRLAAAVVVVGRFDGDALFGAGDALPGAVALPEFGRRRESVERELLLDGRVLAGAVVHEEGVAVAADGKRHVERLGVVQPLLHAVADAVVVVLGLDDGDGQVGGVVEDVVGPLLLAPRVQLAAHDDAAVGEGDLLAHLGGEIPARLLQGRGDVLRADVAFRELFLVLHLGFRRVMAFASNVPSILRRAAGRWKPRDVLAADIQRQGRRKPALIGAIGGHGRGCGPAAAARGVWTPGLSFSVVASFPARYSRFDCRRLY